MTLTKSSPPRCSTYITYKRTRRILQNATTFSVYFSLLLKTYFGLIKLGIFSGKVVYYDQTGYLFFVVVFLLDLAIVHGTYYDKRTLLNVNKDVNTMIMMLF